MAGDNAPPRAEPSDWRGPLRGAFMQLPTLHGNYHAPAAFLEKPQEFCVTQRSLSVSAKELAHGVAREPMTLGRSVQSRGAQDVDAEFEALIPRLRTVSDHQLDDETQPEIGYGKPRTARNGTTNVAKRQAPVRAGASPSRPRGARPNEIRPTSAVTAPSAAGVTISGTSAVIEDQPGLELADAEPLTAEDVAPELIARHVTQVLGERATSSGEPLGQTRVRTGTPSTSPGRHAALGTADTPPRRRAHRQVAAVVPTLQNESRSQNTHTPGTRDPSAVFTDAEPIIPAGVEPASVSLPKETRTRGTLPPIAVERSSALIAPPALNNAVQTESAVAPNVDAEAAAATSSPASYVVFPTTPRGETDTLLPKSRGRRPLASAEPIRPTTPAPQALPAHALPAAAAPVRGTVTHELSTRNAVPNRAVETAQLSDPISTDTGEASPEERPSVEEVSRGNAGPANAGPASRSPAGDAAAAPSGVQRRASDGAPFVARGSAAAPEVSATQAPSSLTSKHVLDDQIAAAVQSAVGSAPREISVRRGGEVDARAQAMHADAFTHDGHVHLPSGIDPSSPEMQQLLAHEAVHVVQQSRHVGEVPAEHTPQGRAFEEEAQRAEVIVANAIGAENLRAMTLPSESAPVANLPVGHVRAGNTRTENADVTRTYVTRTEITRAENTQGEIARVEAQRSGSDAPSASDEIELAPRRSLSASTAAAKAGGTNTELGSGTAGSTTRQPGNIPPAGSGPNSSTRSPLNGSGTNTSTPVQSFSRSASSVGSEGVQRHAHHAHQSMPTMADMDTLKNAAMPDTASDARWLEEHANALYPIIRNKLRADLLKDRERRAKMMREY